MNVSRIIGRTLAIVLVAALLSFAAGCSSVDVGNQSMLSKARLMQGIWSVSNYTLADAEIDGVWVLDAGGRTGYAEIDTGARTLTITYPDGSDLAFHYIQADYLLASDGRTHDVSMALYHPQADRFGMFSYNLERSTFVFRYGATWAAGTITRTGTDGNTI